jgi:hypothetical protein
LAAAIAGCGHVGVNLDGRGEGADAAAGDDDTLFADDDEGVDDEPTGDDKPDDVIEPSDDDIVDDDVVEPSDDDIVDHDVVEPSDDDIVDDDVVGPPDAGDVEPEPILDDGGSFRKDASTDPVHVHDAGTPVRGDRDAAPLDGGPGVRPQPDAAVRPDSGVEPPIVDTLCDPECACPTDQSCDLTCEGSPCWPTCPEGATCKVTSGSSTEVGIDCGPEATCTVVGSNADSVEFTCEGAGDCSATCGEGSSCALGCTGTGSCTLFCGSAANCSLACGDAASCTMVHENATTDFEFSCGLENSEECSASVRTCNAPCPD